MAKTNWQDPKTSEMRSTHVAGLMEAVGKIEDSIGMESVFETNVPLTEVFISSDDRYRIFQAPEGKRNWTAEQAPVIKRNGSIITSGFEIDYGGGAIILNVNDTVANTYTVDVKYTKTTEIDVSADINAHNTSGTAHDDIRESINTLDANKVDNSRVLTDVPSNAKFTDTVYGVATTSTNGLMSSTDKQNLDANTTSRHTHTNKSVIDKFTEVDNKPYYNGEEIGGAVPNLTLTELTLGGRFKIVYNDIEDSLDIEVI